jgi:RNA polymerase sigma-70 factor (ECF subfamily)
VLESKASRTVVPFPGRAAAAEPCEPTRVELSESDLIERARREDMTAWALLYRRHHGTVLRHVLHLTGKSSIAEDLVQETFARALVALGTFSARSSFRTWLHGIAINLVRSDYRRVQYAARAQDQLIAIEAMRDLADGELDRDLARARRTELLYALLDKLSDALREAFVLRYVEGLSAAEAGAQLGIEPGTVRVRAHRARELIDGELARLHADPNGSQGVG